LNRKKESFGQKRNNVEPREKKRRNIAKMQKKKSCVENNVGTLKMGFGGLGTT